MAGIASVSGTLAGRKGGSPDGEKGVGCGGLCRGQGRGHMGAV